MRGRLPIYLFQSVILPSTPTKLTLRSMCFEYRTSVQYIREISNTIKINMLRRPLGSAPDEARLILLELYPKDSIHQRSDNARSARLDCASFNRELRRRKIVTTTERMSLAAARGANGPFHVCR